MLDEIKLFSIIFLLLLTGCETTKPGIKIEIQRVEVPIPVPCKVEIPKKPEFNFDKLTIENNIHEKTKSLLADRLLHLGYEDKLLTALNSCVK